MAGIFFLRPWWLLLGLLSLLSFFSPATSSSWAKVIDKKLLPHLLKDQTKKILLWQRLLWPAFIIILSIAIAGPSWQKIPELDSFKKAPLIIALEVSDQMLASDISPTRLKRAFFKIEDLLKALGQEVSLVAF